jgi:hypothetical protein
MKKFAPIVAIAVLGMTFTSCKKDFTCTCTVDGQTYTQEMKNIKKKDAKNACDTWGSLYTLVGGSCSID